MGLQHIFFCMQLQGRRAHPQMQLWPSHITVSWDRLVIPGGISYVLHIPLSRHPKIQEEEEEKTSVLTMKIFFLLVSDKCPAALHCTLHSFHLAHFCSAFSSSSSNRPYSLNVLTVFTVFFKVIFLLVKWFLSPISQLVSPELRGAILPPEEQSTC